MLLAALACGVAAEAPPAHALAYDAAAEEAFVRLVNAERAARGLNRLVVVPDLVRVARRHTARMIAAGDLHHNPRLYEDIRPARHAVGENVGFGSSVGELHPMFMASPSHRRNVLFRMFTQIGVGVAYDEGGAMYVTLNFAKPFGRAPAARPVPPKPARPKPARPKPVPVPRDPEPVTVTLLLRLAALDALD